jgi:hypothetical protein
LEKSDVWWRGRNQMDIVKIMTLLKLIIGKIGCMVKREKSNGHSEDHDTS